MCNLKKVCAVDVNTKRIFDLLSIAYMRSVQLWNVKTRCKLNKV